MSDKGETTGLTGLLRAIEASGCEIYRPEIVDKAVGDAADLIASLRAQLAQSEANHGQAVSYLQDQLASARKAAIEECREKIGSLRQSEAGLFDAAHSGQRGEDRSTALYDAYHLLRKLSLTDDIGKD